MRPMVMEFPKDPGCTYLDRQYMLGNGLLVAPVFNETGEVTLYLPEGLWTNYWTGDVTRGGRWISERHDYFSLPLYVRENTMLVTGPVEQAPLRQNMDNMTITIYCLKENARLVMYEGQEIEIVAQKKKDGIQISVSKVLPGLTIRVSGMEQVWECRENRLFIKTDTIHTHDE
jgi:alpha-D-xyloside xylohydrolase